MRGILLIVLVAACGGKSKVDPGKADSNVSMIPLPEPVTKGVLSGPLCQTDKCTCRNLDLPEDGGAGYPDEGSTAKRFEIHVGPAVNALWVLVDDMVLYKSDERSEDCFYVDLQPGDHKVILRAEQQGGLSAALDIHELGWETKSFYDTFTFNCGSPGTCSLDALDAFKADLQQYKRNLMDPCGSTKVMQIAWDAGRAPDQMHPAELQLELTLKVYEFSPEFPHGAPECRDRIAE